MRSWNTTTYVQNNSQATWLAEKRPLERGEQLCLRLEAYVSIGPKAAGLFARKTTLESLDRWEERCCEVCNPNVNRRAELGRDTPPLRNVGLT